MEDYKYKLSIIIPMYNAEKYIGNCLDSIFGSDLPAEDYEVVVVNDGSKDKGPEIVAEYMKQHPNLSYYSQENQGQSTARNNGIKSAKGEYVWCVDADDMLDKNIASMIDLLSDNRGVDIFAVQLKQVKEDGTFVRIECGQPNVTHNVQLEGREAIISGYNPSSVCALLIKRDFLINKGLFFKVGITHQDVELSYRLFASANHVFFSELCPYIYILHPNSTSQSVNPQKKTKYLSDDIVVMQSFTKLAQSVETTDKQLADVIMNRVRYIHVGMLYNVYLHRKQWTPLGITASVIHNMTSAGFFPINDAVGLKQKLLSLYLNFYFRKAK